MQIASGMIIIHQQNKPSPDDRISDGWRDMRYAIASRFNHCADQLFTTDLNTGVLFNVFLGGLPREARAHYMCNT